MTRYLHLGGIPIHPDEHGPMVAGDDRPLTAAQAGLYVAAGILAALPDATPAEPAEPVEAVEPVEAAPPARRRSRTAD